MESLLTAFVGAGLADFGDKTQLLTIALAARYGRPLAVLAGVALAALANSLIAAAAGAMIHDLITLRAVSLFLAVALVHAGISGLARSKTPDAGQGWPTPAFVTAAACFFLLEFGDKTQFLTAAIAAQYDSFLLAALGATGGVIAANAPAALLGERTGALVPLRAIRMGASASFLVAGAIVAVNALRLV